MKNLEHSLAGLSERLSERGLAGEVKLNGVIVLSDGQSVHTNVHGDLVAIDTRKKKNIHFFLSSEY